MVQECLHQAQEAAMMSSMVTKVRNSGSIDAAHSNRQNKARSGSATARGLVITLMDLQSGDILYCKVVNTRLIRGTQNAGVRLPYSGKPKYWYVSEECIAMHDAMSEMDVAVPMLGYLVLDGACPLRGYLPQHPRWQHLIVGDDMFHALKGENGIRARARKFAQQKGPNGYLYPVIAHKFEDTLVAYLYWLNENKRLIGRPDLVAEGLTAFDMNFAPGDLPIYPSKVELQAMAEFIRENMSSLSQICLGSTGTSLNESFHAAMR
jgi:hypothetical protein